MAARRTSKAVADAHQVKARYDAAGSGRRIAGWNPPSTGPQRAVEGLPKLRNRAHDATRNDWAAAASVQKWATSLVGVAITPRWKNAAFTELWNLHVPSCDADGVLDAYGMQTLGVRAWFEAGEVFLRARPRAIEADYAVPVQYQLIESDFVPMLDADVWPGMPLGNHIRQGIERNKYGRRIAYWVHKEHPGDKPGQAFPGQLVRVAASQMRHVFEPKRPGQLRGVSELAPMLVRLRASMDYEDAVLDRQKLANLFTMFITRANPPDTAEINYDPDTGLPKWYDDNGHPVVGLEPGMSQQLLPGEDVKFANPPEAGTTYSEYMRSTHLGTAAGGGMPYEFMSGDIKDVSDRTLRVVVNEFRRFARQRQFQIIIPMLCQPMVDWWADAAALAGKIPLTQLPEAKACKWSPEGWEYIHPTQDAEGKKILLEAGLISRERVVGERGDDVIEIDNERSEDKKRADKLGISPPDALAIAAAKAPAPAPAKPKPTPAAVEQEALQTRLLAAQARAAENPPAAQPTLIDGLTPILEAMHTQRAIEMVEMRDRFFAQMEASDRAHEATVARFAEIAMTAAGRSTVVQNNVEPTPVVVQNNIEPTPITNVLEQSITNNVAAPNVAITNEVQPAAIAEIAIVAMPERKTTTTVDRHPQTDEITNTTQIERDISPKKGN